MIDHATVFACFHFMNRSFCARGSIWPVVILLAGALLPSLLRAEPLITELVAANDGSQLDEDGEASDWIELHNPDAETVDLSGWHLTDNGSNPRKWAFPAGVSLPPGGFLVVWASSKNRTTDPQRLHTNFSLASGGEYLALIKPDGSTRVSAHSPAFPALEDGEAFGAPFTATTLLAAGASAHVAIPTAAMAGTSWTSPDFVPGPEWTSATTHLGFGVPTPGFFIEERLSTTAVTTITAAETLLNAAGTNTLLTAVVPMVNVTGSTGSDGRFGDGVPTLHGGDQSNFAMRATATLVIPVTGAYTFHVNSDEGFRLRIDNTAVMSVNGLRAPADSIITRTLSAGNHSIILTYFDNTGGDEVELSAARGTHASFSNLFRLIGDTAEGGLPVLAPSGTGQSIIATDLSAKMLNINASAYVRLPFTVPNPADAATLDLAMSYNDGFIAYLNGVEVARRQAPVAAAFNATATAERSLTDTLLTEKINLSRFGSLLKTGSNTLALHGLNITAADASFLLAPGLSSGRHNASAPRFFRTPTPGGANTTTAVEGHVADTRFFPKRGFYSAPIQLTLSTTTPGAVIRYTLNGSTPTATQGLIYESPLTLSKTTVVRALALRDGYEPTNVDTHTYVFLDDVLTQGGPTAPYRAKPGPEWPNPGSVAGQVIDYGMDRSIVNNANATLGGPAQVKAALAALPSVFLTTDVPNLFHATTGIYTHAGSHGRTWERMASIEMLGDPNTPEGGFSAPCGTRIRGGYSRSPDNPKHSFRIFFRSDYGAEKLHYPVFGGAGASEFDAFDIQCSQNYSWSFHGDPAHNGLREIWSRDTHRALGHPATRGRFVHLYLNGVYWGLYQIQERAEAAFGETYIGGDKDDFDVIKHTGSPGGYTTEATDGEFLTRPDGTETAWKKLWNGTRAAYWINMDKNPAIPAQSLVSTPEQKRASYYRLMGLQADGRTPSAEPALLDVGNLIDYMIVVFLAKNADSPLTGSGSNPNNFYAMRNRTGQLGFVSIQHDAEHSLNAGGAGDRWGPFENPLSGNWNKITHSNPQYFHQDLSASPEYRMRFADHMYRHFFHDGPLTAAKNQARLDVRASQVESGIMAESARWGDAKTSPARNASHWRSARTSTRNWFNTRSTQFITEARSKGFYPVIDPPVMNQRGGSVAPGFQVILTNPNAAGGTIYYSTDGSDPRPVGGGFVPTLLIPESANASYLVPTVENGGSTLSIADWTSVAGPANAASWMEGPMGLGFNPTGRPTGTSFTPFIKTNLQAAMQPSTGTSTSTVYVRLPFSLTPSQLEAIDTFRLRVRYDDGFIAYLNGQEISRKAVIASHVPTYTSSSSSTRADTISIVPEQIVISNFAELLKPGANVLAFHVMNQSPTNADLLFGVQVETETLSGATGKTYTAPVPLAASTTLRTRVLHGTTWSALNEASFFTDSVPASAANIVVSEFAYNPSGSRNAAEAAYASSDFEFIELLNISSLNVDLFKVTLSGAVNRILSNTMREVVLPPGGRLVIAANPAATTARYGLVTPLTGPYEGRLDNLGETIRLTAENGSIIKEFTYEDNDPWPEGADGEGYSLILINPSANPNHSHPANWRSSANRLGRPGTTKGTTYAAWKNEIGSTSDEADPDGDGLATFAEYALGSSPSVPSTSPLPTAALSYFAAGPANGVFPTITFHRRLDADDVTYDIESSSSLLASQWQAGAGILVSESNNGDGTATMVYRTAQPITTNQNVFLRLKMNTR